MEALCIIIIRIVGYGGLGATACFLDFPAAGVPDKRRAKDPVWAGPGLVSTRPKSDVNRPRPARTPARNPNQPKPDMNWPRPARAGQKPRNTPKPKTGRDARSLMGPKETLQDKTHTTRFVYLVSS